ncbi:MAG: hypothetical protein JWM11_222 [Planctomycetaceae bacterium]|nr:hypothetical protein [Planctomycetaceae bacterium]
MPEWMGQAFDDTVSVTWDVMAVRLVLALLFGLVVVGIYKATRRAGSAAITFPATLVLLSILIAMVTQVIGANVARAFSLVGALSVVRFRTVVRDTKDTAFVIFAVVVGMAAGAGQASIGICGLIIVGFTAYLFRDRVQTIAKVLREMNLELRLVWSPELEAQILGILAKHAEEIEATSAETIRQGAGMELGYKIRLKPAAGLTQLVSELSRLPDIQSVELEKDRGEA